MNPIRWIRAMVRQWEINRDEADRLREQNRQKLLELQDVVERGDCTPAQLEILDTCLAAMGRKATDRLKGKKS